METTEKERGEALASLKTLAEGASAEQRIAELMPQPFTSIRISLVNKDSLRAVATCKVGELIWLVGLRVIEGSKGRFVAMPAHKTVNGDFQDYYFPASKLVREKLNKAILEAYDLKVSQQEATNA